MPNVYAKLHKILMLDHEQNMSGKCNRGNSVENNLNKTTTFCVLLNCRNAVCV